MQTFCIHTPYNTSNTKRNLFFRFHKGTKMLTIQKTKADSHIVYSLSGQIGNKTLEEVERILKEDMYHTYVFIFEFSNVTYMSVEAVKMLKKIYLSSIDNAFEIFIEGLQAQPKVMFDIFQMHTLYPVNNTLSSQKSA